MIKIKRAYDKKSNDDGMRVLIDGLWPKGLDKKESGVDIWLRQLAPTPPLRKWFDNDPKKFAEFSKRYKYELAEKKVFLRRIQSMERERSNATLLYGAKDQMHNNAKVIAEMIEEIGPIE